LLHRRAVLQEITLMPTLRILPTLLLVLLVLTGCEERSQRVSRSQLLMGTLVDIVVVAPPVVAEPAIDAAFAEMHRIENLMSPQVEQSDVWRLSHQPGPVTVSAETAEVLRLGQIVASQSGGAFDLTLGRLKQLWGVETATPRVPSDEEIRTALQGIGPDALRLEGQTVTKRRPDLQVDLGGIAKGYAIDRAVAVLRQAGVRHASVNAGGDLRLIGDRGDRPWRIGIQHPRQSGELLATLELEDIAVVTSGDYERFFERDGVRYHHLFNPQTGWPARVCQSVTVITGEAMQADALATAVFVLGPERGMEFLRQNRAEGILVTASGEVLVTPGLQSRVQWP
jgi:FAD:protein FMN transferase